MLGKKSSEKYLYKVKQSNSPQIKVLVARSKHYPNVISKSFARYETTLLGEKKYWFNAESVSEAKYNSLMKQVREKHFSEIGHFEQPEIRYFSVEELKELLSSEIGVFVALYREAEPDWRDDGIGSSVYTAYDSIRVLSEIQTEAFENGFDGTGVGIYFAESGRPKLSLLNRALYEQVDTCRTCEASHATAVARVLQSTAPGAKIYGFMHTRCPNCGKYPDFPGHYNPPIYIGSHSWHIASLSDPQESNYIEEDMLMDDYVYRERVIEFIASGNSYVINPVGSPGKGVNVISVGAVYPHNFRYATYTRWQNSDVHNSKPEVLNFTNFRFPNDPHFSIPTDDGTDVYDGTFAGTSASTPYTAAMAADILSQHDFFKWHPEVFKALILTGSTMNVVGAASHDSDNDTLIKKLPLYSKMAWGTRSAYWNGGNSDFFDSDSSITFVEQEIQANKRYRIAISWLSAPEYVGNNKMLPQDIDLYIYQNGVLIASSESAYNPFEIVDFVTNSNADLLVKIKRVRNAQYDGVFLGYNFLEVD